MNVGVTKDRKARLVRRRKEEILKAAKQFFARQGYRRTKIDQIADNLGVGKGTVYRYFENKKVLFLAVFENGMQQLREKMRMTVESLDEPDKRIEAAVWSYLEFFDSDRELIEILMQVRSEFKDYYMQYSLQLYSEYIVNIQNTLRRGIETGQFRQVDIEKTADAMSDILTGTLQSFYTKQQAGLLVDRAEAVAALILHGVSKVTGGDSDT